MNKKTIGAVASLAFLVGCGCQQGNNEEENNDTQQPSASAITYTCEEEIVKVDFNNDVDPQTATIYIVDKDASMVLPITESASGVKYSDGIVTFWTHQGKATLSMEDTGASLNCTEGELTTI